MKRGVNQSPSFFPQKKKRKKKPPSLECVFERGGVGMEEGWGKKMMVDLKRMRGGSSNWSCIFLFQSFFPSMALLFARLYRHAISVGG